MASSRIYWIDVFFNYCVRLLYDAASLIGISYEEINVWIFCILWPVVTIVMLAEIIRLRIKFSKVGEPTH